MIADKLHLAYQFARAGVLKPSRPDRVLRAALGLHRWGPTIAAGYLGAAAYLWITRVSVPISRSEEHTSELQSRP